jgi:hypothetical protein
MHTCLLIAADNIEAQLQPFSVHLEVEPHEVPLSDSDIRSMAEHYGILPTDLHILASKMRDWEGEDGIVKNGQLARISRRNPKGRVDYYCVGGKWDGFLQLRQPRKLRRLFGLLPPGCTSRVSSAKKSEIDQQALLADPPAALLFRGQWFASPIFADGDALDTWKAQFSRRFSQIPDETTLTVVDIHS